MQNENENLDPNKQAQEFISSCKPQKISHLSIYFNKNPIMQVSSQKHLGIILETKPIFKITLKIY